MLRRTALILVIGALAGCRTYRGRLMDSGERDLVGARQAGTETWSRLVDGAMTELLTKDRHEMASGRAKVAFVELANESAEELGDFYFQLKQVIETVSANSERYRMIGREYVEEALRECRLQPRQLFIPKNMRAFTQVLEQQNNPVDYLMRAVITSGTTGGVEVTQRDYILTMRLINVRTGDIQLASERVRKEYAK